MKRSPNVLLWLWTKGIWIARNVCASIIRMILVPLKNKLHWISKWRWTRFLKKCYNLGYVSKILTVSWFCCLIYYFISQLCLIYKLSKHACHVLKRWMMILTLKCFPGMMDGNYITLTFVLLYFFILCTLKETLFSWIGFFPRDFHGNYLKPSIFVNDYCSNQL